MGFGLLWRCSIRVCTTTASLSLLVNGSPTKKFMMNKGLRQGCPLSPLLFNPVAEALSLVLKNATTLGMFRGARISNEGDKISHIQFADDIIIFCEPSEVKILNIRRILRGFQAAAGLKVNFNKSRLFWGWCWCCSDGEVCRIDFVQDRLSFVPWLAVGRQIEFSGHLGAYYQEVWEEISGVESQKSFYIR